MKLKLPPYFIFISLKRLLAVPTTAASFHHLSFLTFQHNNLTSRRHFRLDNRILGRMASFSSVKSQEADDGAHNAVKEAAPSDVARFIRPTNQHKPSPLAGNPIGPVLPANSYGAPSDSTKNKDSRPILLRYIYEGGHIGQGRLCHLQIDSSTTSSTITIPQLMATLLQDGVDLDTFYACAYETELSDGGWMPLEKGGRWHNPFSVDGSWKDEEKDTGLSFPTERDGAASSSMRIDIKLFRRPRPSNNYSPEYSRDAYTAISSSIPSGHMPISGYFGLAILQPKTSSNIGTLLRSSYQLGASILYTIGGRYKHHSADTLNVPARIPLIELNDWNAFVESAPKSAVWVVIEMGGTPLSQFQHPRNAIYILGSEDHGVPKCVLRGCQEVVSLEAEGYGSYNVAVAGSIVMYDRMVKMREGKVKDDGDEKIDGGDES